ncbi:MAG TPA: LysE family translocator [Acidisoma sp.]|jgi:threonine/homoserine/homoserine lactone efflux protein|uniref:LysE family translocator n=1 Tax=Acidisoma sp. TaxID=1872115 RepID=UPI002CD25DC1|nr:LysE family translocator [Acidisoma sp.]HTI00485.1 LysE family translocator [Acidisoma sp.]
MHWHVWLEFAVVSAMIGLVPGPSVTSIVGYALGSGRRTALSSVGGMAVGNVIAISLSLGGVGAILAASALAFSILKWAGALYLIVLGLLTLIRSTRAADLAVTAQPIKPRAAFLNNVALGTFHPKTIVFFVSFVPQFITKDASYAAQAALFGATFCVVVGCTDAAYALAASKAAHLLRRPRTAIWSQRAGGGVLIAAGVATATSR